MSLDDDLFVSSTVHERDVPLPDGKTHKLYFREVDSCEFRRYQLAEASQDEAVQLTSMAVLIATSLCEPDGTPALTVDRAEKLKPAATLAIFNAVLEVNQFGGKKASPSAEAETGSASS